MRRNKTDCQGAGAEVNDSTSEAQARERFALGDGGSGASGADQSAWQIAGRPGDALVDMAAAMAASRHSNSYVVTASVDYIDFRNAVNLGELVILKSQVNRVFHTSMEVGVEVFSEQILTGERKHTTTAYVTFVAIDEHTKKPKAVRPLLLKTPEEKRRLQRSSAAQKTRLAVAIREII